MAHFPKPFFRPVRGLWYVQIDGKQINLGADKTDAFKAYHGLMQQRAEAKPEQPAPLNAALAASPDDATRYLVAAAEADFFMRLGELPKARAHVVSILAAIKDPASIELFKSLNKRLDSYADTTAQRIAIQQNEMEERRTQGTASLAEAKLAQARKQQMAEGEVRSLEIILENTARNP